MEQDIGDGLGEETSISEAKLMTWWNVHARLGVRIGYTRIWPTASGRLGHLSDASRFTNRAA
jgi:hypothetical protein